MSDQEIINNSRLQIILSLLKKNFKKLIIFLIIIITLLVGFYVFKNYQKKITLKISEDYIIAKSLINKNNNIKAKEILLNIIEKKHKFYSPSSLYILIDNNIIKDKKIIIASFDKIIGIRSLEVENRNLIKIKKALFLFKNGSEKEILETLNPVINSDSVWKAQAIQIMGDYFKSNGENKKSKEYYNLLKITKN